MIEGEDNVLLARGENICLIFDDELDTYLVDHFLPIKARTGPSLNHADVDDDGVSDNHDKYGEMFLEKAGFIEEDIANLIKLAIHLEINAHHQIDDTQLYANA